MKVIWSDGALEDLREIVDHYVEHNPPAARRLARKVFDAVMDLHTFPFRGRVGATHDTRELVIPSTSYIAVYRVVGEQVHILRVRHAAQNWPVH